MGAAMAVGYVYLPIFFQLTLGQNATESGVQMIPMMLGLPVGAILCGALVTTQKQIQYRIYPVIGIVMALIANILYVGMRVNTSKADLVGFLILAGIGMGPNVQVPLLAAQNAVKARDMAVASSAINFFQSVSGLLATAIAQTILNSRIKALLEPIGKDFVAFLVANNIPFTLTAESFDVKLLKDPFPQFYDRFIEAYGEATSAVFNVGIACCAIALAGSLLMRHIPLREGLAETVHVEGVAPIIDVDAEAAAEAALEKEDEEKEKVKEKENEKAAPAADAVAVAVAAEKAESEPAPVTA
jgi:hypothetical protein